MPIINAMPPEGTLKYQCNVSYENQLATWLLKAGWEVLIPMVDHGRKTDLVVADDSMMYRIQVKTLQTFDPSSVLVNMWKGSRIHYVVYFALDQDVGYIVHAFETNQKRLYNTDHVEFQANYVDFCRAFSLI